MHDKISTPEFDRRTACPVPVHHASRCPLDTKNLPVWDLEVLETCIMSYDWKLANWKQ